MEGFQCRSDSFFCPFRTATTSHSSAGANSIYANIVFPRTFAACLVRKITPPLLPHKPVLPPSQIPPRIPAVEEVLIMDPPPFSCIWNHCFHTSHTPLGSTLMIVSHSFMGYQQAAGTKLETGIINENINFSKSIHCEFNEILPTGIIGNIRFLPIMLGSFNSSMRLMPFTSTPTDLCAFISKSCTAAKPMGSLAAPVIIATYFPNDSQ